MIGKLLSAERLAKMNNKIGCFLNQKLNGCDIHIDVKIPKTTKIYHGFGIVIGGGTILGENIVLHHNITLGSENEGYPTIEDNVVIFPNSTIIGKITIGEGSIIGAGSFIDKNIPLYSLVYPRQNLIRRNLPHPKIEGYDYEAEKEVWRQIAKI